MKANRKIEYVTHVFKTVSGLAVGRTFAAIFRKKFIKEADGTV